MNAWQRLRRWSAHPARLGTFLCLVLLGSWLMNAPGLPTSGAEFERLAGGPTFDFRFAGYSAAEFVATLDRAGTSGRRIYRAFMWLDVAFPALYALFWLGVFERAAGSREGAWRWITVVPPVTAAVDYSENLFVALGISAYPQPAPTVVALASASTQLKGVCTGVLLVCALGCLADWIFSRGRAR